MEDVPREAYRQAMNAKKVEVCLETLGMLSSGLASKVILADAYFVLSAMSRKDMSRDEAADWLRKRLRKRGK